MFPEFDPKMLTNAAGKGSEAMREMERILADMERQVAEVRLPPFMPTIRDLPAELSFEELDRRFRDLKRRRLANRKSAKVAASNAHIRSRAIEIGEVAPGVEYWIVHNPLGDELGSLKECRARNETQALFLKSMSFLSDLATGLNGYVAFPKRHAPLRVHPFGSFEDAPILEYIPVHGGITYACKDATACVFGFDTAHFNSENVPRTEKSWIAWQCRVLYQGVKLASKLEPAYRRAQTNEAKAKILQPLLDMVPEEDLGTGALIRILGGEL